MLFQMYKTFQGFIEMEIFRKNCVFLFKERLSTLKKQTAQITQQAQREKESFLSERSNLESMMQRVTGNLCLHMFEKS